MSTIVAVRHPVEDFEQWKVVFDQHRAVRESHGANGHWLLLDENEPGTQLILNEFPDRASAEAFASDPSLADAMARAGVTAAPRIEFYETSERIEY
jgi:hypothetical protein